MSSGDPAPPEVWWSPGMGLIEQVDIVGDEALYECLNADDEGRGALLHHLPSDAVELVAAPSVEWCEQMHERDRELERLRGIEQRVRAAYDGADSLELAVGLRYLLDGGQPEVTIKHSRIRGERP